MSIRSAVISALGLEDQYKTLPNDPIVNWLYGYGLNSALPLASRAIPRNKRVSMLRKSTLVLFLSGGAEC